MNKVISSFGIAVVAVAAFGLVACEDSSSGPSEHDVIENPDSGNLSSSDVKENPASSEDSGNLSSGTESSSSMDLHCDALTVECGYTRKQLCEMGLKEGLTEFCDTESSSSQEVESSSSITPSSSSRYLEKCVDMDRMCPVCNEDDCPIPVRPCDECEEEGLKVKDCNSAATYTCVNWRWTKDENECVDVSSKECDTPFAVVLDCAKSEYLMCVDGKWLNASGCDPTKERCGFGNDDMCTRYKLREFCDGSWLEEPCSPEGHIREFPEFDSEGDSYSYVSYVCTDGKWKKHLSYFICPEGGKCGGDFSGCWESSVIGTSCNEKDRAEQWISDGDCEFQCVDGAYRFVPPPVMGY